jgi:hypothetical protein
MPNQVEYNARTKDQIRAIGGFLLSKALDSKNTA